MKEVTNRVLILAAFALTACGSLDPFGDVSSADGSNADTAAESPTPPRLFTNNQACSLLDQSDADSLVPEQPSPAKDGDLRAGMPFTDPQGDTLRDTAQCGYTSERYIDGVKGGGDAAIGVRLGPWPRYFAKTGSPTDGVPNSNEGSVYTGVRTIFIHEGSTEIVVQVMVNGAGPAGGAADQLAADQLASGPAHTRLIEAAKRVVAKFRALPSP